MCQPLRRGECRYKQSLCRNLRFKAGNGTIMQYCSEVASTTGGIKWKNHFYEMKGDVGMSLHEK